MLSHRDVSALLGLNKTTSMWELWHINKGSIQRRYQESARSFWSRSLRPQVLAGLQERYRCKLAPLESRTAFGVVKVSASLIIERGELPVGDATHIVVDMISTEGHAQTYGKAEEDRLPTDRVRASLVQDAFGTDDVGFFLFIGNGEKEEFFTLGLDAEAEQGIAGVVRTFLEFVQNDREPEPDYEHDTKALSFMAASKPSLDKPLRIDGDPDLLLKVRRYQELSAENSTLSATARHIEKERGVLKAYIADKMRGYTHGIVGNGMIQFTRQVRNVKPRVDEYVTLNIK